MQDAELQVTAKMILLRLHAVTGWAIPANEIMHILVDEFKKKISESYKNVNADEFSYAVRTYGPDVKDWGKAINLSLIDEVIQPYLAHRFEISRMEEYKSKPLMIENKESTDDKAMNEWLQETKERVLNGTYSIELLPVQLYDYAMLNGFLDTTKKAEYFAEAKRVRLGVLKLKLIDKLEEFERKEINSCIAYIESGSKSVEHEEYKRLALLAKRLMLVDYFKK